MAPIVVTQFGDKKVAARITEDLLKEMKKLTGKDSDYGALKAAALAGLEHLRNCSTVPDIDKLVKEVKEMPDNVVDKKLKKLRMHGRHSVQNLNEELVHYAASGSDYTLFELIEVVLFWAKKIAKVANISFEEALRMRFFGDTRDIERAVGYYSKSLARDIAAFRHYANRYEEMDGIVDDRPKADFNDIVRRVLQKKKEERELKEGKNG
jgi:hypothetical protein